MSTPAWFVGTIALLELGAFLTFAWQRRWIDALYWFGVSLINVALVVRAVKP